MYQDKSFQIKVAGGIKEFQKINNIPGPFPDWYVPWKSVERGSSWKKAICKITFQLCLRSMSSEIDFLHNILFKIAVSSDFLSFKTRRISNSYWYNMSFFIVILLYSEFSILRKMFRVKHFCILSFQARFIGLFCFVLYEIGKIGSFSYYRGLFENGNGRKKYNQKIGKPIVNISCCTYIVYSRCKNVSRETFYKNRLRLFCAVWRGQIQH